MSQKPRRSGRTAIVTGASRGIGLAVAKAFAAEDINVIVTARSAESAEAAAAEIGRRATGVVAHAADEAQARRCVQLTLERHGSIDILVNNAGTNPAYGPWPGVSRERFEKTVDVNLWAPIMWASLAWEESMRRHGGAIVNVASVGGLSVEPSLGAYNATKAALIHITRQLAVELAPGVRVNAVAPGVVRTRLAEKLWRENEPQLAAETPLGRIGEPDDVAQAVSFLAGPQSGWMTGETLVLDGGRRLGAGYREAAPDAATETRKGLR